MQSASTPTRKLVREVVEAVAETARNRPPTASWSVSIFNTLSLVPGARCCVLCASPTLVIDTSVHAINSALEGNQSTSLPVHVASSVPAHAMMQCLLATCSKVPPSAMRTGEIDREEWPAIGQAARYLSDAPLTIEHASDDIDGLPSKLAALSQLPGLSVLVVHGQHNASHLVHLVADAPAGPENALLVCAVCSDPRSARPIGNVDVVTLAIQPCTAAYSERADLVIAGELQTTSSGAGELFVVTYDPNLHRIGVESAALEDLCDESTWDPQPLPDDRKLSAAPPPLAKIMHLNADELAQALHYAERRASQLAQPDQEIAIGLFLAFILPYFKGASRGDQPAASIPRDSVQSAMRFAGSSVDEVDDMLELVGITEVSPSGHFEGTWRAASFKLPAGCVSFSADSPQRSLHSRSLKGTKRAARWASVRAAAGHAATER